MRYQSRVAAWLAARMLDGPQAVALWGLPAGTTLSEIWCEAPFNPDDIVLRTSDDGLVFCQAKSGRVALSSQDGAPLRRAFSQFVARYRNVTATDDNPEWQRPLDHQRDRLVLLVESQAGRPLVRDGRDVLERLRAAPRDREPQRSELSESRSEQDVLGRLLRLLQGEWESQAGHRPDDGDVWSLLRLVHIQPADVGDDEPEGREARDTLARLTRACGSPGSAWSELLEFMESAQARGGPMCSQSIAEALACRGVPVRPLPRVAPDIEALKSRTLRALESLLSGATLPGPNGPVVIDRPVVDALDAAWAGGPVVVVGEAGAGKTAVLVRLAQRLLGSGHDVVLLRAEELTSAGPGALRQEFGLTLDLQEVLRGWVGSKPAVIVVDALDAARDRSTLTLLNELMRDLSALPRWRVVASVREYDLEHGPEIKALFRGTPPSPGHADARFQDLRHIAVARLSDAELDQATSRLPHLARVLGPGHTQIRDLLRSPFNLRLAAELLADGVAVTNLECARTRMDLLDQFWSHRVPPGDRERALDELVDTMVDRRSLQLDEALFRSTITSAAAREGLLRDAVLVKRATPYGHDVAFAHNILFDHAVARLKLRRRPDHLAAYLRSIGDHVLALLPSIRMHFEFVWSRQNDREPLWDLVLRLGSDDTVPTIVRRLGVAAAVDLARDRSDLDPLLRTQTRGGSGPSGAPRWLMSELAGALCLDESVDRVRRHGDLWAHVAERLSLCIGADWDPVAHTVFLLIRHLAPGVELTPSQRSNVGAAARRLVRQAWTRHWAPEGSRVALAGVCQTYRSDPAASATIIRECFAPHHLATRDCQDVPVLAREIGWLMEAAPELVAEIYERIFAHAPAAPDERTVIGASQILRLTSDRRQDYEAALWSLGAALPRFLDEAPQAAARALSRVVRGHRAKGHGVSTGDAPAETFTIDGRTARVSRDYSRIWDSDLTFGQSPAALLEILERKIVEHATAQDHPWLDTVLQTLAAENLLAAPWRRVLAAAAQIPEVLGLRLADALQSPVVLLAHDLRDAAGALLAAVYPLLAVPARERTERVIMALPETAAGEPAGRDYADWRRGVLLGHLRDQDLATPEASAFLADLLAAGEPPSDAPAIQVHTRFIGPQTAEHWLQYKGVDVASVDHRALAAVREPVTAYCDERPNDAVERGNVERALPLIRDLRDHLDSDVGLRHAAPARTHALGVLAAGAARAVGATAPGSEARALLVDILIRASRSEDPVFEPEEEERFEQTLAWGEPSERVHAAEGLLAAARGTSEPHVLEAMDRLADDPVGAVRYMIAARLLWLAQSAPDVCRRIAERRLSVEASPAVMVPLIDGSAAWLGQRDAELAFRHVASILKRFSHLGGSDSRRDVRRACLLLLAEWYLQSGHESADSFAEALLADPLADPLAARWFASSMGRHLRGGGEAPAAIARAWRFIEQLSATAVAAHGEWKARRVQDTDGAAADALGRARAAVEMGEEVARALRVASGATEEQVAGTPMLSCSRKRQLLDRAAPVIEGLTTLPSAQCALDLICVLESVVSAAPKAVIPLLSLAVSRGTSIGLEHEVLVSERVVRIVEACLAQHREIFRADDACRSALLTLLDTLADAGWPAARRLQYRLDEIYR